MEVLIEAVLALIEFLLFDWPSGPQPYKPREIERILMTPPH